MDARIPLAIAGQTFTEARRNKIFYSLFFFALVVILNSILFTEVTVVALDRILKDTGMAAISLFALVLTIFIGVGIINREIDRRSIYAILAKPSPRYLYVVGKYLGLLAILAATTVIMFVSLIGVMIAYKTPLHSSLFAGYLGVLVEMAVLGAFAVLCSSFTSSFISAFFCIALFISGHLSGELLFFSRKADSAMFRWLGEALYYVVPNLERFNFKVNVTYDLSVATGTLVEMSLYGLTYVAAFLIAAVVVFSNRDFR